MLIISNEHFESENLGKLGNGILINREKGALGKMFRRNKRK